MTGEKQDQGKLRYDLIPAYPLAQLAEVYTIGARKYGDNNWRKGMAYSRIIAALIRHLESWRQGREVDPDDGQHPLASVAWCAFTLMEYEITHPELDDRADNRPSSEMPAYPPEYASPAPTPPPGNPDQPRESWYDGK